uniref:AarF domain containing kinase 2 n=1 Tax=Pseudonaja textilis TaxID=8673 RepID=A0A670YEK7_PSETE
MSIFCYWTARNFFPSVRILTVKKTLCFVRKWRKTRATRFTRVHIQNWSECQAVAKILFVCWGIEGLSRKTKCEGVAGQITNTNVSQARLSSVAFLRDLGFAFSVIIRGFILLLKFSPLIWFYPFIYFSPSFATLWLHLLLKFTESSGPTFIKLGQWASTRRDLFSEEFCVKFSKLHIKVIPHPWDYTKRSLDKAFGEVWEKIFMFESREPIGSGCVAQVYKAYVDNSTLRDPVLSERTKISVLDSALEVWKISGLKGVFRWFWWRKHKDVLGSDGQPLHKYDFPESIVLHPGLVQQVQMDLFLMKIGSRLLELFPGIRWLSVTEIVEEFEKLMIQQIDLRYEAKNLEHFHLNFKGTDYVRPLPSLIKTPGVVFVDNFVHADLHPGNILVQGAEHFGDYPEEGTVIVDLLDTLIVEFQPSPSPLRLVLLDAGIVAELQSTDLENFRAVFTGIVLGQGEKVAELILHHSRANQCKDVEKFKADMAELVTRARNNAVALGKFQVGSLLSSVFKLLMTHQVRSFTCKNFFTVA